MKKKFLALVLTLAMVLSLVPVTALATGATQEGNNQGPVEVTGSDNDKKLTMKKTVTPVQNQNGTYQDGTYTVRLESYAKGEVTPTTTTKQMDIVLLLDVSGSMDQAFTPASSEYRAVYDGSLDTGKQYYIQRYGWYYEVSYCNICNKWTRGCYDWFGHVKGREFVPKTAENDNDDTHTQFYEYVYTNEQSKLDALKTAVNQFIEGIAENSPQSNISIVKFAGETTESIGNETYGTGNNKENYTQIVEKLTKVGDGGANRLKQAVSQLTAAGATSSDYGLQKAQKALENATKDKVVVLFTDGEPNHFNGFDYKVATTAVNTAKTLKQNNTTIYTVGVFKNPDNDINLYMSSVSSNYPEATATAANNGRNWTVTNGDSDNGKHYINAENAADLINAFKTISSQVSSTHLNGNAVVVDKVPSNFKAPANDGDVTLKVANYKVDGTFDTAMDAPDEIHASVNGNGTVSVTGFDFSKNWCGLEGDTPHGQKLIIEFTIERTNYGGTQPTNDGAYIKANANSTDRIIWVDNPQVPVTISLGIPEAELNEKLGVSSQKEYNGSGIPILSALSDKANTLANGTKNAYVDMELTVEVGGTITYTYKIPAGRTTGSWYKDSSTIEMTDADIAAVTTPKDVKRENNEVEPYTYTFDLKLSDANPKDAESGAESKEYKNNNASFKITPKDVTVKAKDKTIQAGDPKPQYDATVSGTIGEDRVRYTISCDYDPTTSTTETTFAIKPTGEATQGNYNVSYENGTLTVTEAPVTTGTLKVTKEVQGDDLTLKSLPSDFKITVTGPNSYNRSFPLPETVGDSDKTVTWTISDLPTGTYTVSEENADVNGYDCTARYSATNGATVIVNRDAIAVQNQPATDAQASQKVTVTENRTSTMTVTNKYKKQEVEPTPDTSKPDVNKTATALVNDKTEVTLSVGGKSAKENVAVMFLLDKSTSMGTRQEAAKMLQHLKGLTNTNIIYDVVIFSGTASSTGWQDISNDAEYTDTQENFTNKEPSSGTNMPVGIDKAIQDMETLNSQYSSYAENAYLITISDGITYLWDEDGTTKTVPVAEKQAGVGPKVSKTVDTWDIMYGPGVSFENVYTDFASFLTSIPQKMEQTKESGYVCDYTTSNPKSYITVENTDKFSETNKPNQYACAPEFSVYYSATKYQELVKPFTKSFALPMPELKEDGTEKTTNWEYYPWGRELMLYLQSNSSNSGQSVVHDADAATIFAGIRNEILYEIKSGSITDVIGADFSLTDQTLTKDTFTLKVKGEKVAANEPSGNEITFGERDKSTGKYPYVLTYYKGTATKNADNTYTITSGERTYTYTPYDITGEVNGPVSDEFFVLEMNVPVVSLDLKYNLSLTSKRTASGTYEVPTNESATLAYQSANQSSGTVDFNEPTVSYRVKGSSGGHSGGTVTIPDDVPTGLNGKDHYAYVVGYPDGMVYPQKNITRAEVATIFFRLLTDETREANMTKSNSYNDMKDGAWYTCAVSTLSKMGIIKGYEDGSFKPDASISRAEFAAIAARFDPDGDKTPATFSDVSSHWAKDEISIAANHGWIKGYEDGSFKPDQKITRAETMTLVNRVLKRLPETKDDLHKDMKTWPDNQKESAWFYLAVQEATNSHYQKLKKDGTHETWESMRETRDWAALEK